VWDYTDLVRKHMSPKVLQRQLELLRLAAKQDLDDDGRVQRHGDVVSRRHDGRARLAVRASARVADRASAICRAPRYASKGDAATDVEGVAVEGG
jgi:hypothetical protein